MIESKSLPELFYIGWHFFFFEVCAKKKTKKRRNEKHIVGQKCETNERFSQYI